MWPMMMMSLFLVIIKGGPGKPLFSDKKVFSPNKEKTKPKPPAGPITNPGKLLAPIVKPKVVAAAAVTNPTRDAPTGTLPSSSAQQPTPTLRPIPVANNPQGPLPKLTGYVKPKHKSSIATKTTEPTVSWELVTPQSAIRYSDRAVVGGHEGWDGSPLWVIRSRQGRDVVPGKFAAKHSVAYVPFDGKEMEVQNIEVLCAPPGHTKWVAASEGSVPPGAIHAGHTMTGEVLYVGRVQHEKSLTPGKVHPSHRCCYISYSGKEVASKKYEVLCHA